MTARGSGFVLIELIVVLGVLGVLLGLVTVNLLGVQHRPSLAVAVDTLVADMKGQQTKAMSGVGASAYGVYIGDDQYVLFVGSVYNALDPANAPVPMDPNVLFSSVTFPGRQIVFAQGGGDIVNFDPAYSAITLRHAQSGQEKSIELNRYGTITNIH